MHPAIATVYQGVQYRSRLEARWAAFFDLLGWKYQYEPFDLEGWIPDFLILGKSPLLVEIKPVTTCPADISAEIRRSSWRGEVAILGCVVASGDHGVYGGSARLGWTENLLETHENKALGIDDSPIDSPLWDDLCTTKEFDQIGCSAVNGAWFDLIHGGAGKGIWGDDHADEVVTLWNQAGNLTQWKGKQSVTDARR